MLKTPMIYDEEDDGAAVVVAVPMRMATVRNWRSWWYQPIRVAGHHSYSSPGRRGECSCDEWKMPSAKWLRRQAAPEMRAKEGREGLTD